MAKGFGGFSKNMNMQGLLKQAQDMQTKLQKAQEDAKSLTAEGTAGGGAVKVVARGDQQIESITIDSSLSGDVEMIADLALIAVNLALKEVNDKMQKELSKVTGGMNIPGF